MGHRQSFFQNREKFSKLRKGRQNRGRIFNITKKILKIEKGLILKSVSGLRESLLNFENVFSMLKIFS